MDATQMINDSVLESDEEENEEDNENKRGRPLAKLCILKNVHVPETELSLFVGENVLGRDPSTCNLPLPAPSISKQHATICISVYRRRGCHSEMDVEALIWDLGSMNGTRKGRLKLTPNVRYALSDGDSLALADIPCQFMSCAVNVVSQGDTRTPMRGHSRGNARLQNTQGETEDDKSTGSKTCVNGGAKARVPLTNTPVTTSCLPFEQTPMQPQGILVPESDSDSDGERGRGGERRRKALVSDSDSHKSSPSCSTFLSPTNKIVPESEDESPIIPSSSTKNRPYRHVSFSKEQAEVDVVGQLLEEKKALAIVDDSEDEEEREKEREASQETKCEESGQHVPLKQESSVILTRDDELPQSTPPVSANVIPAFNMDSDTDMEGEEEGVASAGPVTLNTNQISQPPNTAQFPMDSDTDVDEDEGALDEAPKTVPSSDDSTRPALVNSLIQPEGISVDSDTDVEDDYAVSDTASKAKAVSFQCAHTADSAPLTQPKDFHLDSDTDVDEDDERECRTNKSSLTKDETPTRLDIKAIGPESAPAAPPGLHLDSDTDDEALPAPALSEQPMVSAATESCAAAEGGDDIDTDVEGDSALVVPIAVTNLSFSPCTMLEAQSDSVADTDVDASGLPTAGDGANAPDLRVGAYTGVEDKKAGIGDAGEDQIPHLCREKSRGLQNCSTPEWPEEEMEDVDTQAFPSPLSVPFRRAVVPALRPVALSSCSDSQEEEDFVVTETQSFVLQTQHSQSNPPGDRSMEPTQAFGLELFGDEIEGQPSRGGSFRLGLSDSSLLQSQAHALAMESTQAFVSVDGNGNMEDTQAYISTADETSAKNDPNLEATQAYGEDEGPATLGFSTTCSLAMAETQPMSAFIEEERLAKDRSVSSVQVKPINQDKTEEKEKREEPVQTQQRPTAEVLSMAETQPMHRCDSEESDDEELLLGPQKSKAGPLQLEEEQTQPVMSDCELLIVETQPMHTGGAETQSAPTSENEEGDDGDSMPGPRKRKEKQVGHEEEETLANTELSAFETQPVDAGDDGESDEEDSIPISRKRRAKALQLEEESQPLSISVNTVAPTQPISVHESEQSDEEDLIPGLRKRKAKPLPPEEEQTQSLTAETQPIVTREEEESDDEDSISWPRKRKAKALQLEEEETQPLTIFEGSTIETQPLEPQSGARPERPRGRQSEAGASGVSAQRKRGTTARLREDEEQTKCSEPPKRQTRGKNKASAATSGGRGKSEPNDDESEEEQEVEQTGRARGKISMRQQKTDEEEAERRDTDGNEHAENGNLIKAKQEGALEEERDVADIRHQGEDKMETDERQREEEERERQHRREEQEKLERERKEKDEREKLQAEYTERIRLEQERAEKERKEEEEKERAEKEKQEQLEKEKRDNDEKERLARDKAEREEKAKLEREEKDRKEKERLREEKREEEERLERERKEREERERLEKEKEQQVSTSTVAPRGRRAARRTIAAPSTTEPQPESVISTSDDGPARRTRSRSNSSNSVSSERSASSIGTQEVRGRGRGRGAKRTSEPPQVAAVRSSNRRRTVAAETTAQDGVDTATRGALSRSNSSHSLDSEISSCSVSSQNRGRAGRQRGRQRKTDNQSSDATPKPAARARKGRETGGPSNTVPKEDDEEKGDSQQASATRGRHRANVDGSKPNAADEEDQSYQEEAQAGEEAPQPERKVRGRGQNVVKSETVAALVTPSTSEGEDKRKGTKRELQANAEEDSSSCSKILKGKEEAPTTGATEEEGTDETKDENPVPAKRRGRASTARAKKNAKEPPPEVKVKEEGEIVERRARGQPPAGQKDKKEAAEPQTPTSSVSRKRQALAGSSPLAKTPRSSAASPTASGRLRAANQAYRVLFTGVMDEDGERVLARLGGGMAKDVADMNFLVTDKVRRTVKFLCAVAKGVPIVTPHWLEKSGKAGSFLPPNAFVVKDPEQEKKFTFCLQESLRIASSQPLLKGYEIHVTKSVKPEPVHMKDIISCSGATFLPKMPSVHKPQTVVISCEDDWSLCGPALSASLPVVTAEFMLTGILQQKVDFQAHTLPAPVTILQPAGGRSRGRKKT